MPQRKRHEVTGKGSRAREPRNGQPTFTYRKRFARTGDTPASNVEWLVRFVTMPLAQLDRASQMALIEDVFDICTLAGSDTPALWKKIREPSVRHYFDDVPGLFGKRWREVLSLHTIAMDAVTGCADRQPVRLPRLKIEMDLDFKQWRPTDRRPLGTPFYIYPPISVCDDLEPAFIYRLACILFLEDDRVGRCHSATCTRPLRLFLRTKSGQCFCSNTCRSREAMKRFRTNLPPPSKKGTSRHGQKTRKR